MAFEQPVLVEVAGELADAGAELLEGVEALDPQHLFLERLDELLDASRWSRARSGRRVSARSRGGRSRPGSDRSGSTARRRSEAPDRRRRPARLSRSARW